MTFSKIFKSSNAYSGLLTGLLIFLAIVGILTLMSGSNSKNNYITSSTSNSYSYLPRNKVDLPLPKPVYLPKNDTTSLLDTSNNRTLEEEVISNMAPVVTNENLGNPSYLPVIDSNLSSTDINELL